jgi:hypothetical protein
MELLCTNEKHVAPTPGPFSEGLDLFTPGKAEKHK